MEEKDRRLDNDKAARYFDALVDLDGDGKKEAIVYLVGRTWCGSGGCPTLVLVRNGVGWKLLQYITITRPPIRVLSSTSHGWHDLSVWVQGGGHSPGLRGRAFLRRHDLFGKSFRSSCSSLERESARRGCNTFDTGWNASVSVIPLLPI